MAEIVYCDDYEALTGKQRAAVDAPVIETKVVEAPIVETAPATVAETA